MNLYDKASLIVTPNAYKASKIYSVKPDDGSGDLSFSRAGTAMRRNSSGLWETVGANVPRLHYPVGAGCPIWLEEPQKTNLFLNSNVPVTQAVTVSNATVYTVSIRGIGTVTLSDAATGTITGTDADGDSITITTTSSNLICTVSGVSGQSYVQVEEGILTSPIITGGSAVTRLADVVPALVDSSLFGTSGCTWFIHFKNNIAQSNDGTHLFGWYVSSGGFPSPGIYIAPSNNTRLRIWTVGASNIFDTTADESKIAIVIKGTLIDVYQNGVKVVSDYAYNLTPDRIGLLYPNVVQNTAEQAIYPTILTNAECIALTTL